jgi:archaellin
MGTQAPLLQEGQYATIQVQPSAQLNPRDTFDLEIKPENGASLGVERTVPAGITNTTLLY